MQPTRLDGELAELDDLISEYRRSVTLMPQTSAELLEQVHGRATALHLPTDLDELEVELARTKRSLVPMGLHVWGQAYTPQEARLMVRGMAEHGSFDGELAPALSPSEQAKVVGKVLGEVSDSPNETSLPKNLWNPKTPKTRRSLRESGTWRLGHEICTRGYNTMTRWKVYSTPSKDVTLMHA